MLIFMCVFQLPEDWSSRRGPQMPLLCQGSHLRHCHFQWRALPSLSPPPSAHGGEGANLQKSCRVDPAWKGGGTRKEYHGWGAEVSNSDLAKPCFPRKFLESLNPLKTPLRIPWIKLNSIEKKRNFCAKSIKILRKTKYEISIEFLNDLQYPGITPFGQG